MHPTPRARADASRRHADEPDAPLAAVRRLTPPGSAPAGSKPHWVIAELDARGEIDRHAAMCLELAVEVALRG